MLKCGIQTKKLCFFTYEKPKLYATHIQHHVICIEVNYNIIIILTKTFLLELKFPVSCSTTSAFLPPLSPPFGHSHRLGELSQLTPRAGSSVERMPNTGGCQRARSFAKYTPALVQGGRRRGPPRFILPVVHLRRTCKNLVPVLLKDLHVPGTRVHTPTSSHLSARGPIYSPSAAPIGVIFMGKWEQPFSSFFTGAQTLDNSTPAMQWLCITMPQTQKKREER